MQVRTSRSRRVPDAGAIAAFRERPGVWLTFAGSAYLSLYAERLQPLGLKPNWVTALAIVAEHPGITQSALGRALTINRASAMAVSALLESAGFLLRLPLPGRKQTALKLTDTGLQRVEEACAIEDGLRRMTFDRLPPDQVALLLETLKAITALANGVAPEHDSDARQPRG